MLIDGERSQLLLIDLQEKMVPAIADEETIVANCRWLLEVAQMIGVPVGAIEQYPKGLGPLIPAIRELLPPGAVAAKTRFSVAASAWHAPRRSIARSLSPAWKAVCVLRTVLDLYQEGKEVFVVADCVGSRHALDREVALAMRQGSVRIVSREMVVFSGWGAGAAVQGRQQGFLK
jgi:nicotinamidase-related amidase